MHIPSDIHQKIESRVSTNFIQAYVFVFHEYPWMFDELAAIELVPAEKMTAYGYYYPTSKKIVIRMSNETVLDFIDTLVHELIHHIQFTTQALAGGDQLEREANNYAYLAVKEYKTKRGIPEWK